MLDQCSLSRKIASLFWSAARIRLNRSTVFKWAAISAQSWSTVRSKNFLQVSLPVNDARGVLLSTRQARPSLQELSSSGCKRRGLSNARMADRICPGEWAWKKCICLASSLIIIESMTWVRFISVGRPVRFDIKATIPDAMNSTSNLSPIFVGVRRNPRKLFGISSVSPSLSSRRAIVGNIGTSVSLPSRFGQASRSWMETKR